MEKENNTYLELAPTLHPVASDRIGTTPAGRKKTKEDGNTGCGSWLGGECRISSAE